METNIMLLILFHIFPLTLIILNIAEYRIIKQHLGLLNNNIINLPTYTHSFQLANQSRNLYIESQIKTLKAKKNTLLYIIISLCIQIIISFIFITKFKSDICFKILNKKFVFLENEYIPLEFYEINLISLFITVFIPTTLNIQFNSIFANVLLFFLSPYIVIFYGNVCLQSNNILKAFLICHLSIKIIFYLLTLIIMHCYTKIHKKKQLDINLFSYDFKSHACKYIYENKIHIINEKEKFMNAFIIKTPFFSKGSITIIGSVNEFSIPELESILFHELGHCEDKTYTNLIIRIVNYLIFYILFFTIYELLKPFSDILSQFTVIMIYYIIFSSYSSAWINFINNFFMQNSEENADRFAFKNKKNMELASALFKMANIIPLELYYTRIWGLFYYTHPSTFSRIENLTRSSN
ncbi:CAAX prenyl protease 1 like protein [Astathelohania contejeani]|uniref:CAAX prenyl protease 1 like protein n=1 Tax=Astathelohania contejeani TaxID=164912 RepID=A0ABQ7HZI5_9MICR|nr:CAAX prenyl protease 1 like protein [Thelohania contejeani]